MKHSLRTPLRLLAGAAVVTAMACSQDGQVAGPDPAMTVTPGPLTIGVNLCKVANDAATVGVPFDFDVSATGGGVLVDETPTIVAQPLATANCVLVWERFNTSYDDESMITIEEIVPLGYKLQQISYTGTGNYTLPPNETDPTDAVVTFAPLDGITVYFKNIEVEVPPDVAVGRITGGGIQFNQAGVKVTRGFTLHCDIRLSNNLEINWPKDGSNGQKDANNWHLTRPLSTAECIDLPDVNHGQPAAPFDRFIGTGWGKLNGVEGAYIEFEFTDHGEPGKDDTSMIKIWKPGDDPATDEPVLYVERGPIKAGNFQVHCDQPHGSNGHPCLASDSDT